MALTFYLTASPVLMVLLIVVLQLAVEIPLFAHGFIPMVHHTTSTRRACSTCTRPRIAAGVTVALRVDLTDTISSSTSTTEGLNLESLREMLQELRAALLVQAEQDTIKKSKPRDSAATSDNAENSQVANRNLSPDELAREILLSTRIPNLKLCHTRLGPSTLPGAGRGLFATHDIVKGDLITCYPGDALLYEPPHDDGESYDEGEDLDMEADEIVIWGAHVDEVDRWDEDAVFNGHEEGRGGIDERPLTDYALWVCELYSVLAMPLLDTDPAYSGHFANDAGGHLAINGSGGVNVGVEEGIAAYVNESIKLSNAQLEVLEDSHMVAIARRNISEGEEIFVTYGMNYWMENVSF